MIFSHVECAVFAGHLGEICSCGGQNPGQYQPESERRWEGSMLVGTCSLVPLHSPHLVGDSLLERSKAEVPFVEMRLVIGNTETKAASLL